MTTLRLGSLFTGIGGIDLAFQRAGFEIGFQVEIDDYCNKVLARHWPAVSRFGDIRNIRGADLPAIDVLAGGFPCQDISAAGRGAGIKEGTRSGLWIEFARLIGEIRPRIVLLENVAAILARDGVRVIADLTALGYDTEWGIMAAADAGAPHRRERWFCVAYPQSAEWRPPHSSACQMVRNSSLSTERQEASGWVGICSNKGVGNTCSAGLSLPWSGKRESATNVRTSATPDGTCCRPAQSIMGRAVDGLSRQLDGNRWPAGRGQRQHEWEYPRTVASGEIADRVSRIKALGNAVVPQVIYPIAVAIREYLEADR